MTKAELLQKIAIAITMGPSAEAGARIMAVMAEQPLANAIAAGMTMGMAAKDIEGSWRMLRSLAGMPVEDAVTDEEKA